MEGLPRQDEVIFLRFPHTDLSGSKNRPAVTLAPLTGGDILVCQITSQDRGDPNAIVLGNGAFAQGGLPLLSYARAGRLFTAHASILTRRAGVLRAEVVDAIIERLVALLREGRP